MTGNVTANAGTLGGFTIGGGAISSTNSGLNSNELEESFFPILWTNQGYRTNV